VTADLTTVVIWAWCYSGRTEACYMLDEVEVAKRYVPCRLDCLPYPHVYSYLQDGHVSKPSQRWYTPCAVEFDELEAIIACNAEPLEGHDHVRCQSSCE